jgi:hypothetical protein
MAVLATEELKISNMSRSAAGTQDKPSRMVKQKAGLNREILSAGLSMARNMLAYKAVEAGTRLHVSNTRQLKPSRRQKKRTYDPCHKSLILLAEASGFEPPTTCGPCKVVVRAASEPQRHRE